MSSSILSLRAKHSLVLWQKFWWNQKCLLVCALREVGALWGVMWDSWRSHLLGPREWWREVYVVLTLGFVQGGLRLDLISKISKLFYLHELSTFFLNLSKSVAGFLHKLSTNDLDHKAITMWCSATSGFRSRICKVNLSNYSMKALNNSPLSCLLIRVKEVRWCGQLVKIFVVNRPTNVSQLSTEPRGNLVN